MNEINTIYVRHIPKTAGTSVRHWLLSSVGAKKFAHSLGMIDDIIKHSECSSFEIYCGHFHGYLDEIIGRKTIQCTILRNPIDRTLSHWREIISSPHHPHYNRVSKENFEEFIHNPQNEVFIKNYQARYLLPPLFNVLEEYNKIYTEDRHTYHLSQMAEDLSLNLEDCYIRKMSFETLSRMALIGTTDQLPNFIKGISKIIGITPYNKVPFENFKNTEHVRMSHETINRITNLTNIDNDLFKWASIKNSTY